MKDNSIIFIHFRFYIQIILLKFNKKLYSYHYINWFKLKYVYIDNVKILCSKIISEKMEQIKAIFGFIVIKIK